MEGLNIQARLVKNSEQRTPRGFGACRIPPNGNEHEGAMEKQKLGPRVHPFLGSNSAINPRTPLRFAFAARLVPGNQEYTYSVVDTILGSGTSSSLVGGGGGHFGW